MIELLARRRVGQEKNVVITFEDSTVKNICVNNWGGNVIPGEITTAEAAAVTTLSDKFNNNTSIIKFNELKYFIGLTTLCYSESGTSSIGAFYGCTNLAEVTIPAAPISNLSGVFRECSGLVDATVDFSPITSNNIIINAPFRQGKVKKVILPGASFSGNMQWGFQARSNSSNASIETLEVDGTASFMGITNWTSCFAFQIKLKDIK